MQQIIASLSQKYGFSETKTTYATAQDRDLVTRIHQNAGDARTANHALAG